MRFYSYLSRGRLVIGALALLLAGGTALYTATPVSGETATSVSDDLERLDSSEPKAIWIQTYGENENAWYRHQDLAYCESQLKIGLIEEDHDPSTPPAHRLWLYQIDHDGVVATITEVPKPEAATPNRPKDVSLVENLYVECGSAGDTLLAFNFPEGIPWIVSANQSGAVRSSRRIGDADSLMKLAEFIQLSRDSYLLLGHGNETAIAVRLDGDGQVISQIDRDYGFEDTFVSGCYRGKGGGLALVGNSKGTDRQSSGESLVWLSAYDNAGYVEHEVRLSGRFGTLVSCTEDGGTLVYDRGTDGRQAIWAVTFDAALSMVGEVQISDAGGTLPAAYVAAKRRDGTVFVLGNKLDHAYLTKLDSERRLAWTHFGGGWGRSLDFRLAVDDEGHAYVLFSGYVKGDRGGFRRRIKLAKVRE